MPEFGILHLNKHRDALSAILGGKGGVKSDENVRKVATFCSPLLPSLLRLVIKEPAFVNFVMDNREKLLARLVAPALQQA